MAIDIVTGDLSNKYLGVKNDQIIEKKQSLLGRHFTLFRSAESRATLEKISELISEKLHNISDMERRGASPHGLDRDRISSNIAAINHKISEYNQKWIVRTLGLELDLIQNLPPPVSPDTTTMRGWNTRLENFSRLDSATQNSMIQDIRRGISKLSETTQRELFRAVSDKEVSNELTGIRGYTVKENRELEGLPAEVRAFLNQIRVRNLYEITAEIHRLRAQYQRDLR